MRQGCIFRSAARAAAVGLAQARALGSIARAAPRPLAGASPSRASGLRAWHAPRPLPRPRRGGPRGGLWPGPSAWARRTGSQSPPDFKVCTDPRFFTPTPSFSDMVGAACTALRAARALESPDFGHAIIQKHIPKAIACSTVRLGGDLGARDRGRGLGRRQDCRPEIRDVFAMCGRCVGGCAASAREQRPDGRVVRPGAGGRSRGSGEGGGVGMWQEGVGRGRRGLDEVGWLAACGGWWRRGVSRRRGSSAAAVCLCGARLFGCLRFLCAVWRLGLRVWGLRGSARRCPSRPSRVRAAGGSRAAGCAGWGWGWGWGGTGGACGVSQWRDARVPRHLSGMRQRVPVGLGLLMEESTRGWTIAALGRACKQAARKATVPGIAASEAPRRRGGE